MLNKVMLIGHTGNDVEMHHFEGGGCLGRVSLATNESYTNKTTGEKVTNTEWHRLVVRNKGAEVFEKYVKKGAKIYVEGKIKTRKWQDANGADVYTTEIEVWDFKFLDSKPTGQTSSQGTSAPAPSSKPQHGGDEFLAMGKDEPHDDLPF